MRWGQHDAADNLDPLSDVKCWHCAMSEFVSNPTKRISVQWFGTASPVVKVVLEGGLTP